MSAPCGLFLSVISAVVLYYLFSVSTSYESAAKQSHHWINDCRLLEKNIENGYFSSPQHRLLCGDVIENVRASEYDLALSRRLDIHGPVTIKEWIEDTFKSKGGK